MAGLALEGLVPLPVLVLITVGMGTWWGLRSVMTGLTMDKAVFLDV